VKPHLLVTPGDPRGIGPEVAARAIGLFRQECPEAPLRVIGPEGGLDPERSGLERSDLQGLDLGRLDSVATKGLSAAGHGDLTNIDAGRFAGRAIERAVALAMEGVGGAIVTGPLHKPSLQAAGWAFPGQTEMLADLAGVERVGMLMAAETTRLDAPLRVLLATTHLPLAEVPTAVTSTLLVEQLQLLHNALVYDWGIPEPRLGLCALNPHASDDGLFGAEEALVFEPAVIRARAAGITVDGPLPADTVFSRTLGGAYDAVVAPYHDVGMAAFKTVSFGTGVNVSIGLPFVRTSPDHGTAFDIAGSDTADAGSMLEALRLAWRLANTRFDTTSVDV
jgi:4-hydroxythreonine-4-phosphate dehydrogenase